MSTTDKYYAEEPRYLWYCGTKKYRKGDCTGTVEKWYRGAAVVPWYCATLLLTWSVVILNGSNIQGTGRSLTLNHGSRDYSWKPFLSSGWQVIPGYMPTRFVIICSHYFTCCEACVKWVYSRQFHRLGVFSQWVNAYLLMNVLVITCKSQGISHLSRKSQGSCGLAVMCYRCCDSHKINIVGVLLSKGDVHKIDCE